MFNLYFFLTQHHISFSKINGYVIGKLNFYENENVMQNIQMIYTYTEDKKLIRIEEEENGKRLLLWDRKKEKRSWQRNYSIL